MPSRQGNLLGRAAFAIAERMRELIPPDIEVLGGLELGCIPLATAISLQSRLPAAFIRKKTKEYGTRKLAEGPELAGKRLLIIEDVITTGGAVLDGAKAFRALGARRSALGGAAGQPFFRPARRKIFSKPPRKALHFNAKEPFYHERRVQR
ncbi:MAG: hypothetical protein LBU47_06945 [Christensenellaceae bacterium]|jgi:orotate phosphoribosyltransferase|nr:hypothetical protein [Christensenellaceae bacterium]